MLKRPEAISAASRWTRMLATVAVAVLATGPRLASAGEGGTAHVLPGANATLVDLLPTTPGPFFKPMYLNYEGSATVRIPTAAGVASNIDAEANTFVLGGGYTFHQPVRSWAVRTTAWPRSFPTPG